MTGHQRIEEMIAAVVLGSLDDAERAGAEREILEHTTGCASCRSLYAQLRETAADLALAAPARPVPEDLERRILARAKGIVPAAVTPPPRPVSKRLAGIAAAVMLIAVGGLAAIAVSISGQADRAENRVALMARALSVVGQPDARRVSLRGSAPGTLVLAYQPGGQAVLIGSNVPAPQANRLFELWLLKGSAATPAGIFRPDDGVVVLPVTADLDRFDGVAVTEERRRVAAPTGSPVWSGRLEG